VAGKSWKEAGVEVLLDVTDLTKTYLSGGKPLTVLSDLSYGVREGETWAIVGPSGSGKTTLLALSAGLDTPSSGSVRLAGQDLAGLDEDQRAALRNRHVGFVFQNFQLLPTLTALENVRVPLELRGGNLRKGVAEELLERVGLGDRQGHYPAQLSGGEQQRVAIARAFVHQPRLLFADEPTGNLDPDTAHRVMDLLFEWNRTEGTALVLVTHDLELAGLCQNRIRLRGGRRMVDA
jgi:putative ABC transport system ATP-binding protein